MPFGLFLGVTLSAYGEHPLAVLAGAALVYGGSAQLATSTVLHAGAGLLAAVLAGVVVSARMLLYGAALADRFADQPRWFRWLGPATLLDQTYLSALNRPGYRVSPVPTVLGLAEPRPAGGLARRSRRRCGRWARCCPTFRTWCSSGRRCSWPCWCRGSSTGRP